MKTDIRPNKTSQYIEKEKKTNKEQERDKSFIKTFLGKDVVITLRNKDRLKGKLDSVSQYELMLIISKKPMLIMKHAIDYIELADTT